MTEWKKGDQCWWLFLTRINHVVVGAPVPTAPRRVNGTPVVMQRWNVSTARGCGIAEEGELFSSREAAERTCVLQVLGD